MAYIPLPRLTDIYKLKVRETYSILSQVSCVKDKKKCDVHYVDYSDIVTAITQRFYDYDYYFNNLVATSNNQSSAAYLQALAGLTDTLSPNLTSFTIQTNGVNAFPPATNRAGGLAFLQYVAADVFQGYSAHNTTNIRVRPIFDSETCQASSQSQLIQYAFLNPGGSPPPAFVGDVGTYNFTWAYENGVWRIKTYLYNDRLSYTIPSPFLAPTLYAPNTDVSNTC